MASLDDFLSLQIRVGTIVSKPLQKGAPEPAPALRVDVGEPGRRNASTPITDLYDTGDRVGLLIPERPVPDRARMD